MQALEERKGRTLTGIVVSDKNDKTIVVRVETLVKHPLLKKYVRRRKKFTAHDPMNECGMGDKSKLWSSAPCRATSAGIWSPSLKKPCRVAP